MRTLSEQSYCNNFFQWPQKYYGRDDTETVNSPVSPYTVRRDIKSRSPLDGKVLLSGNLFSMIPVCLCASALPDPFSSLLARPYSLSLSLSGSCSWGASLHSYRTAWAVPFCKSTKKNNQKKSTHMKLKNARALTHSSPCVYTFSAVLKCLSLSRLSFCLLVFLWDFFFGTLYTDSGNINIGSRAITISTLNYV